VQTRRYGQSIGCIEYAAMEGQADIAAVAREVLAVLGTGGSIAPLTGRPAGLSLRDAYRVTARLGAAFAARGEPPIGRKIGFTNTSIWAEYNVYAPIWG
jgi:2-oxo-3-hexenedioate decarboxylase